jgi:hypothetical protein
VKRKVKWARKSDRKVDWCGIGTKTRMTEIREGQEHLKCRRRVGFRDVYH